MQKSTYRALVLASVAIPIAGIIAEQAFNLVPIGLVEAHNKYMSSGEPGMGDIGLVLFTISGLIFGLTAFYGMLRFRKWAPKFNVAITVIGMIAMCFTGPVLMSSLNYSMVSIGSFLYGAVLFMAFYVPEVRAMFWPDKA